VPRGKFYLMLLRVNWMRLAWSGHLVEKSLMPGDVSVIEPIFYTLQVEVYGVASFLEMIFSSQRGTSPIFFQPHLPPAIPAAKRPPPHSALSLNERSLYVRPSSRCGCPVLHRRRDTASRC
jgi:hypothetical protein